MSEIVQTAGEFLPAVVNLTDDSTVITSKKAILRGIYVNTAMTGAECLIKTGGASGSTIMRIPALATAGSWYPAGDIVMGKGITVDPDNSGGGELLVVYKELP